MKKINWKEGMGTTLLNTFIIMSCFFIVMLLFQQFVVYDTAVKAQVVTDTAADGAAVYAALPMEVDQDKAYSMVNTLIEENQKLDSNVQYTLTQFDISKDLSRKGFKDNILSVQLSTSAENVQLSGMDKYFRRPSFTKVRILSTVPEHVDLGNAGMEISRALSEVPLGSPQYNAIVESMQYYGWKYSQPNRWTNGARDCSSFVLSCYRDYTTVFDNNPYGYTQTIWNDAKAAGLLYEVNASDLNSNAFSYRDLQVGDILLWHGSWADDLGREPKGLGHTGIYLGVSSVDGLPKIIHASSSAGGVCVSNLSGMHSGTGRLLGYVRIP